MAVERVKVEGLKECLAALRELPKATAKNVMRRVLKKRAQPVVEHAQRRAPKLTGNLRLRIIAGTQLSKRQRLQHKKEHRDVVDMFIGPAPGHAKAIATEFGTFKDAAQPWLRPAWDAERHGVLDGIAGDMWEEIRKAAERMARKAARAAKG